MTCALTRFFSLISQTFHKLRISPMQVQHPCKNETSQDKKTTPKNEAKPINETKQKPGCENSDGNIHQSCFFEAQLP